MACPNTEDGFVMIAVELGSALAMVDLTKGERLVVWEVVAQTYGKAKLPEARVSPADVAARTNTERAMISKAVRSLLDSNILAAGPEEQTYRLQKDYERWDRSARKEDAGTAEARATYAVEAVARSNGKVPRTRPGRPKADAEKRVSTDTLSEEMRVSTDTVSVSLQTRERVSTDTDNLLVEFRVLEQQQATAEIVEDEADEPFHPPTLPMPSPDAPKAKPPWPHAEHVARIEKWIRDSGINPMPFECKIPMLVMEYPPLWVELAVKDATLKCEHPRGPLYLARKMLRDWKECGGPENDPIYTGKKPKLHGGPAAVPNAVPDYLKDADQAVPAPPRKVEKSA